MDKMIMPPPQTLLIYVETPNPQRDIIWRWRY